MSYKLIRELEEYQQDDEIPARDYLIAASNPDGTPAEQTFKMTIRDVVSEYNREVAKEQAEKAASGDDVLGGSFSEVQIIDGKEVLLDATPITAANIDTLVDPGSGLEVIEICYNAAKESVPCLINGQPNPEVKYKQKKLSFAKSASSKYMTLQVNADTGISYEGNESSFKPNSIGTVEQTFKDLTSAFSYINAEIVSESMKINILMQTDTEEPFFYGNGFTLGLKYQLVTVIGAGYNDNDLRKIHIKHGVGKTYVDPTQVDAANLQEMKNQWDGMQQFRHGQYKARVTAANPNPTEQATLPAGVILSIHACVPMWCNTNIDWRGIHFVGELHGDSIFAFYRQVDSHVYFSQCKFSVKTYTRPDIVDGIPSDSASLVGISHFFDIRDGATMHVRNLQDGTAFQDYSGISLKGIDASGLELDLQECNFIHAMFLIERNSRLSIVEYRHTAHAFSGQAARTFPSRITITSPVIACTNWFQMTEASSIIANAPIVAGDTLSTADLNITYALQAEGFCVIRMWGYTDEDGVGQPHVIPGINFSDPKNDADGNRTATIENIDYRNTSNVLNGIGTLKSYSQYYDNFTAWPTY